MPIGKNSISRVAGEPAKAEVASEQEKKVPARKPRTTGTAKTASSSAKKSTPKKTTTAPKATAPAAEVKTETVERIEQVAAAVTQPVVSDEVKAYVAINDELPTYLL